MAAKTSSTSKTSSTGKTSTTVNGKTVTDPDQVARIERNREASAMYAEQAYNREGTPIPSHLQSYVGQSRGSGDGTGAFGLPDPMSGRVTSVGGYTGLRDMLNGGGPGAAGPTFSGGPLSRIANSIGVRPMGGGAVGGGGGGALQQGFSYLTGGYTGLRDMFDGGGPGASRGGGGSGRTPPTPGPNYTAGLGAPGTPRDDDVSDMLPTSGSAITQGGLFGGAPPQPWTAPVPRRPVIPGNMFSGSLTAPTGGTSTTAPSTTLTGEEASRLNDERSRVPTYEQGGMVGPDGIPIRPSTATMDLPPALARMLQMPKQSYAEGGMVGPGGVPQRPMASPMAMNVAQQGGAPVVGVAPPGQAGRPLNFAAVDQQAQQFMQQNPQQVGQIRAQVQQAMDAGEVDAQSLNLFVQIATTALQSPEMWPQLRQVLIRQGMLDAEDVGEEYDQGFLIVLYIIGKTMGGGGAAAPTAPQGGGMPMSAGQEPQMSMAEGGALPAKSKNPDGSIPIDAHEGEYVIPADVTRKLGTDHFDKMIAKARGVEGKGEQ